MVVACKLLGSKNFFRNVSEEKSKIFKRSIFVVKILKKVKSLIRQTLENTTRIWVGAKILHANLK